MVWILLVIGIAIYFLPTIIGWNKRNVNGIIAVNLFLGWTLIGWVVALVWAFESGDSEKAKEYFTYVCPKCGYRHQLEQQVRLFVCPQCHTETPYNVAAGAKHKSAKASHKIVGDSKDQAVASADNTSPWQGLPIAGKVIIAIVVIAILIIMLLPAVRESSNEQPDSPVIEGSHGHVDQPNATTRTGRITTMADGTDVRRVNLWSSTLSDRTINCYLTDGSKVNIIRDEDPYFLIESADGGCRGYCMKGFVIVNY